MNAIEFIKIFLYSGILSILCVSCYYDIKHRKVSNRLTELLIISCIPLAIVLHYNIFIPLILSGVIIIGYTLHALGGADLKALPVLFFIVPDPLLFFGMCCVFGIIYVIIQDGKSVSWKSTIPAFVPITMAFINSIYSTI